MKKISCIIIDDEPLARDLVVHYLNRLPGWKIVATCRNVAEAYEALYQNSVDVLFLDINMPEKTGIEFLATLKNPPLVVFTTAYAEYAAKAFDLRSVDYLVKPITEKRFDEAVKKIEQHLTVNGSANLTALEPDHVFLKQDNRLVKVTFNDVLYVEALKDFSKLFLKEKTMLIGAHLKLMENLLPATQFIRIHRSYIVALDKITAIQGGVIEIGKQEIPVGATYKEELLKRLHLD